MLFSMITVTRNNLDGLKRTHKSLGAQTFRDFEWIVVDGGSSDGSAEYLATTRAIWCSDPDDGIYDAMNKAIPECNGDYILFLNAGDMLANPAIFDRIARTLTEQRHVPDFIYGDSLETRPGQLPAIKKARSYRQFRRGMFTHHQAMFYRREALGDLRYNLAYKIAADYELTCRFLKKKRKRQTLYIELPICIFESGGISQTNAALGRKEQARIRRALRLCNPISNLMIRMMQAINWRLRQKYPGLYHRSKAWRASIIIRP